MLLLCNRRDYIWYLIDVLTVGSVPLHAIRAGATAVPWVLTGLCAGYALITWVWLAARVGLMETLGTETQNIKRTNTLFAMMRCGRLESMTVIQMF